MGRGGLQRPAAGAYLCARFARGGGDPAIRPIGRRLGGRDLADRGLVAVAARTTTASSGVHHASNGYVETAAGHRFPFLLRWQASGRTGQIDEILPYDWPFEPAHLSRWVAGPGRTGVHAPPQPRFPLGPVGELLWRRVISTFGLPAVLRCLAALWRLPDEDGVCRFARPRGGRGRHRTNGVPTSEPDNRPLR